MPYSAKQRREDVFLLACNTWLGGSGGASLNPATNVFYVPVSCTIDSMLLSITTGAAGTTPSAKIAVFALATGQGAVSGGTQILTSSSTAQTPSGAAASSTVGQNNAVGGDTAANATILVTAPTGGATASWNLDRGNLLAIQVTKANIDNLNPITVQIWAYRRSD